MKKALTPQKAALLAALPKWTAWISFVLGTALLLLYIATSESNGCS